jgi:rod shape determining protein RodA
MLKIKSTIKPDIPFVAAIGILVLTSAVILRSIAPQLFPFYFFYFALGIIIFFAFVQLDFEAISYFDKFFYIGSIFFLLVTLIIGNATRGAVRWIPLGPLTIQTAEFARPLLLIFFAKYLTEKEVSTKRFISALMFLALPVFLILIQPSLGVAVLTTIGFLGVTLSSVTSKKFLIWGALGLLAALPAIWFLLAPYQRQRVSTFLNPSQDPTGKGYNSLQSMITVGSGELFGRGLGKGVQTQLSFLPERHTDFIFASVAEELGLVGAIILLAVIFFVLFRLTTFMKDAQSPAARAFLAGLFLTFFAQTLIHVGMNMGLLPITGVPLPLVSSGGSSFLATMMALAIALRSRKQI